MVDRRQILKQLGAIGIAGSVAGCASAEDEDGASTPTATPSPTGTPSPTATEEPSLVDKYPSAFATSSSTGIIIEQGVEAEADSVGNLYIRGTAVNTSDTDYDYVGLEWTAYSERNAEGNIISTGLANISGLPAGRGWEFEALVPSADGTESWTLTGIDAY